MDIIKKISKFDGLTFIENIQSLVKKSREVRNKILNQSLSNELKVKLLIDDIYLFNVYNQILLLNSLKSTNKLDIENFSKALELINNYNYEFNQDVELLKKVIEIYSSEQNPDIKFFLFKIIKSQEKMGTCNKKHDEVLVHVKNIDKITDLINDFLVKPVSITIDRNNIDARSESIVSSVYPDKKNNILIDKSRYYYLLKKIADKNVRNNLEHQFMKKYNDILPSVTKLVLLRYNYAKNLGYSSFYQFSSNKSEQDTENLKIMLNDLNDKLDTQLKSTLELLINKYNNKNKLSINDMIYSLDKLYPEIKFKPVDIIQTVILLMMTKFNVKFKQSSVTPINMYCNTLEIYDKNNNLKGYLMLDLVNNKKVKQLTLLKLAQCYGETLPVLYLLGNYTNLEKEICSISDVVIIFREFGTILNNIFVVTPTGVSEDDVELINFVPDLMEFFVFDKNILFTLCKNKLLVKQILDARYHEMLINIKLRCINVLFDNIIHSSSDLINLIKKDKELKFNILFDLYKKVYSDIFDNLSDYIDFNITNIIPQVIHNTINGFQGLMYGNILSFILAFNAYTSINSENKLNMLFDLLQNKDYSYKKNLIKFISEINDDYYAKFLKDCLKVKDVVVDNYFDDTTNTVTEKD